MIIFFIFHISLFFKVMHFVFFILIFFTFLTKEVFVLFPTRESTFLDCKQNVGAGLDTLMSISDGLRPSIFCQKMGKARPIMEEMDSKVVCFSPELAIFTLVLKFIKYFSLFVP